MSYFLTTLNNGVSLSLQVGSGLYCEPRCDDSDVYTEVEIDFVSKQIDLLNPYLGEREDSSIYCYVPVKVVQQIIKSAGGLKSLSPIPPGILTKDQYRNIYERCSKLIPLFYKESWLAHKAELQDLNVRLTPHQWCFEIYSFLDDTLVKEALRKWATYRIDEMDYWGIDDMPDTVDVYAHYKKSIEGWDESYPLTKRLALIKKQLNADINLKHSHDDWLMDRDY